MESTIVAHLVEAFETMRSSNPATASVDFDALVRMIEDSIHESDRQALRRFGTRADVIVAHILAPFTETGEVAWEPESRSIAISDFALLLLRSRVPLDGQAVLQSAAAQAAGG
jgi:hypothetical protein